MDIFQFMTVPDDSRLRPGWNIPNYSYEFVLVVHVGVYSLVNSSTLIMYTFKQRGDA